MAGLHGFQRSRRFDGYCSTSTGSTGSMQLRTNPEVRTTQRSGSSVGSETGSSSDSSSEPDARLCRAIVYWYRKQYDQTETRTPEEIKRFWHRVPSDFPVMCTLDQFPDPAAGRRRDDEDGEPKLALDPCTRCQGHYHVTQDCTRRERKRALAKKMRRPTDTGTPGAGRKFYDTALHSLDRYCRDCGEKLFVGHCNHCNGPYPSPERHLGSQAVQGTTTSTSTGSIDQVLPVVCGTVIGEEAHETDGNSSNTGRRGSAVWPQECCVLGCNEPGFLSRCMIHCPHSVCRFHRKVGRDGERVRWWYCPCHLS